MRIPLLAATLVGVAFSMAVSAQQRSLTPTNEGDAPDTTAASATPVATSGIRVYVDPQTGRRTATPTEEQRRAAAAQDALNANFNGHEFFTQERLPSGAVILRTHGRNQSVVLARPGAQGAIVECTDPLHAHVQPLAPTAPTASDER